MVVDDDGFIAVALYGAVKNLKVLEPKAQRS